jgi:uncharacterized protein (DUF111 family)
MPVPAPATLHLMKGMRLCPGPQAAQGELVTPTGAALVRALCGFADIRCFPPCNGVTSVSSVHEIKDSSAANADSMAECTQGVLPPSFRMLQSGTGAGSKDFPQHPNILRVVIGDTQMDAIPAQSGTAAAAALGRAPAYIEEDMCIIEANIDDMAAELLAHLADQLLSRGANDVWQESVVMKKGRVATKLCILCPSAQRDAFLSSLFHESTSIGARVVPVRRVALPRKLVTADTSYGAVAVKVSLPAARSHHRVCITCWKMRVGGHAGREGGERQSRACGLRPHRRAPRRAAQAAHEQDQRRAADNPLCNWVTYLLVCTKPSISCN